MKWGIGSRKNKHLVVEAGFSSPQVKANVEKTVSMEVCSQSTHPINSQTEDCYISLPFPISQIDSTFIKPLSHVRNEDVVALVDSLVNKRQKNTVIVGECLADCDGVVTAMKDRIERGDVPLDLKYVQFLRLPIVSMKNLSREEVDSKLGELRCLLKSSVDRGAVFYLGDLRWVSEYLAYDADIKRGRYCLSVEHMIVGPREFGFCLVLSLNLGSLQAKNNTTVIGDLCSWPLLENRINMDVRNNGSFVIASYSDLSTSKEDVVCASRLRSCGVPLIKKAIMRKSHCGFVPQPCNVEYVTDGWTGWNRQTAGRAVAESHPGPFLFNLEDKVVLKERVPAEAERLIDDDLILEQHLSLGSPISAGFHLNAFSAVHL
ncbi:hypothetical protein Nepgr_021216 [Nepenthes gracilis]|uniref:Uncharacterized protein n=1 Tax=Nepenthes gracilis TaxID=150966 RepID=A0AAD3SY88_NEPGR|nr:hypothetical protein Nepgr_021216 [Nepenthes gracilis]